MTLIAREGDTTILAGKTLGQLPTTFEITNLGFAWRAVFTDNTQAIIYTPFVPVPEPACAGFLGVAGLAVVGVRNLRPGRAQTFTR